MLAVLMARRPVSKELWRQLRPLIPAFVPSTKGGARKLAASDEAAINGILFVLQTSIPWEDLPQSLGYRSEERRVGKSVDLGGRRIIKKKKNKYLEYLTTQQSQDQ